jgi:DNA-binding NtrC family response regulator
MTGPSDNWENDLKFEQYKWHYHDLRRQLMATVLVLDDLFDAVNLVKRVLQAAGHEVFGFTDENDAIGFVKKYQGDLAILDIKLKHKTGVEILAEIKKIAPATRVIMLTAYPTVETTRESFRLGASEYCTKPIDNEVLQETVKRVLDSE